MGNANYGICSRCYQRVALYRGSERVEHHARPVWDPLRLKFMYVNCSGAGLMPVAVKSEMIQMIKARDAAMEGGEDG